ncbi:MAG: hypothetical protein PHV13_06230 [Candidatus ainarchaeum sp.]|nr:hypothetical protein [Candidatus ainarchaeum sp.]
MMHLARHRPASASRAFAGAALLVAGILSCSHHTDDVTQMRITQKLAERHGTIERLSEPSLPDSTRASLLGMLAFNSVAQLPGEADLVVLGVMAKSARCGGPKEARIAAYHLRKCASSDSIGSSESAYASVNIAKAALEAALNNQSLDWYTRDLITEFLKNPKKGNSEGAPPCCETH